MKYEIETICLDRESSWRDGLLPLLSAPAFLAGANNSHSFVIRKARVFDGHKVLSPADVWVEDGKIKALGTSLKGSVGLEDD